MSVGNSDFQFKSSQPPPTKSTEAGSREAETVGGQLLSVKQKAKVTGTTSTTVFKDEVAESNADKPSIAFKDPGPAGEPTIAPANAYKPEAVQRNEWLNSTFMVRMAICFTAIAMLNKEIHKVEGAWLVRQLAYIWRSAEDIAALIMAKAEKEAAMHMALAIAAVASLVVAIVGAGMTIVGKGMSTKAKNRIAELDEGVTPPPNPQKTAQAGANKNIAPSRPTTDAPQSAPEGRTINTDGQIKADAGKKPKRVQDMNAKERVEERQKMNDLDKRGDIFHGIGMAMTQATPSVGQIFENLIQMFFKPQIAHIEQQIELARASKDLASKALDSAIQGVNSAGQDLDAAMQSWTKEQDENNRAHMLKGG